MDIRVKAILRLKTQMWRSIGRFEILFGLIRLVLLRLKVCGRLEARQV